MTNLLDTVLSALRQRREAIEREHGVRIIGVVGSVARGEAGPESDVDVLIDMSISTSLYDLSDVRDELSAALHREVDLVDREMLRPEMRAYMEKDLVAA